MEELELRRIREAEAERQRWWESLSETERQAVRARDAREKTEEKERQDERTRREQEAEEKHRQQIQVYEDGHGGSDNLKRKRGSLKGKLNAIPGPDGLSVGGVLIILVLLGYIPSAFFAMLTGSFLTGLVIAQAFIFLGWVLWIQRRRDRAQARIQLQIDLDDLERQFGCGRTSCTACYPDRRLRNTWEARLTGMSLSAGCGVATCSSCYPRI